MKAPLRTKSIGTKVSEEEFAALEATARAADMTLSGMRLSNAPFRVAEFRDGLEQ